MSDEDFACISTCKLLEKLSFTLAPAAKLEALADCCGSLPLLYDLDVQAAITWPERATWPPHWPLDAAMLLGQHCTMLRALHTNFLMSPQTTIEATRFKNLQRLSWGSTHDFHNLAVIAPDDLPAFSPL